MKKHKHSHGCCEHCIHHCPTCNVTYCCKCGEEWGKGAKCYPWYPKETYPWIYCDGTETTTADIKFLCDSTVGKCSHSH